MRCGRSSRDVDWNQVWQRPDSDPSRPAAEETEVDTTTGLELKVVLWPQSTTTSVGPPDSAVVVRCSGVFLTIKEQYFNNFCNWHSKFICLHICFIKVYVLQGMFKWFEQEKVNSVSCVWFNKQILTVSYIRTIRNLVGPPDIQDWWSDFSLSCTSIRNIRNRSTITDNTCGKRLRPLSIVPISLEAEATEELNRECAL